MNKLTIIGNLTRDPELRTTSTGVNVCTFSVAVNRRGRRDEQNAQPEADFFRVTAWRQLGENCARFLTKGRKVCVIGPVSVHTFTGNDGLTHASLEVTADDVEFLSSRADSEAAGAYSAPAPAEAPSAAAPAAGFTAVETDELPF
jgi:single-strand DNA-binding protein